jgi:hypothetical protein
MNRAWGQRGFEEELTPRRLEGLGGSGKNGTRRGRTGSTAALDELREEDVDGGDVSQVLRLLVRCREVEEDAAVRFLATARLGDVQKLGADGFLRRRPWRRGGGVTERGEGKNGGGRARVRVWGLAAQLK